MAVAGFRDEAGGVLLAVEVADKAADGGDVGGDGVVAGEPFGDGLGADVDGDMLVEQVCGDAKGDVLGHAVRGVVGGADDPAGGWRAELAEGFAHRSRPAMVHQPEGMAAAAASRASGVS